jgi:hypothetical protein
MSANLFGKPKAPSTNLNISKSIVGTQKTPDQLAAEAAAEKERIADANAIEMKTYRTDFVRPIDPDHTGRVHVGGRRRKSRRGKSRKYKRTLKRRKNKTKNRK